MIPVKYLNAARQFAATKHIRTYLNGVYVEHDRLVGCDGVICGVFRLPEPVPFKVLLPNTLLDRLKIPKQITTIDLSVEDSKITISYAGTQVIEEVDCPDYPNYHGIIPKSVTGEAAQFDINLLNRINKAAEALHGKSAISHVRIAHNGQAPALIHLADENFTGCIMPLRDQDVPRKAPAWVFE
jgi:DNA polymerase III sliding clamp (beta) subunit (PCNA family)